MTSKKKSAMAVKPLWFRIIKFIFIMLACAVLLAAIAERIKHYYWHLNH
jgi:hypothetical protein